MDFRLNIIHKVVAFTVSSCSGLQLGMSVVEVSNGGTEVGAVRNFTCGEGAEFLTINTSYTVVRCEANGDWVTYTGERVDNSIEGCIKTQPEYGKHKNWLFQDI